MARKPEYRSNADRRATREELVAAIQDILLARTRSHWLDLFKLARIPAGPINSVAEVSADTALHQRGLFYRLCADGREVPQVGTGIVLDGKANVPRQRPPALGEHTTEILRTLLGYSDEQLPVQAGTTPLEEKHP
jgi:crotonobetainyl-CoA:carnitine CoA-transferase CaiB-like acyl-CoA transferase